MLSASPPSAASGLGKLWVIAPAAFLNSLAVGFINLGMIFVVKEVFFASPATVGWFGALWTLAYFVACVAFRGITSKLVPRVSMLLALITSAAALLAFLIHPSLAAAFVVYGFMGLATAFYWPPLMGWLSRGLEGRELSRATGIYNISWSVGGIISPYLAGMMSQANKLLPLYAALGTFVLTAVFIGLSRGSLVDPEERPVVTPSLPRAQDMSTSLRFPAWAAAFALYAAIGVISTIFPLFARNDIGLSESRTGLLMTLRAAASTVGFVFFGRTSFWRFKKNLLILPTILSAVFSLLLCAASASLSVLRVGLIGVGFAAAWAYNNSMFYGASGAPDRDRRMTIHEALITAGQVLGSLVGGILYQAGSMRLVYFFIMTLSLLGFGIQVRLLRNRYGEPPAYRPPMSHG